IKTIVNFCGIDCYADCSQFYEKNRKQAVIQLVSANTDNNISNDMPEGMPVATATVCIQGYPFEEGTTAIKEYSENQGILEALVSAGIVKEEGKSCMGGVTAAPVVKILKT